MPLYDSVYFIGYGVFLCGAYLHTRKIKRNVSFWIMVAGVLIDFFGTVIPHAGFKSLAIGIGVNSAMAVGIVLGVLVWMLFLCALFVRLAGNLNLFYNMLYIIKIGWFLDLVLFVRGVYSG